MRGASFGGSLPSGQGYKASIDAQNSKNSSITAKNNKLDVSLPSPPTGSESPPSPTGSPELNISSPPRLSLESRLADLFSEGNNSERNVIDNSDSESEADNVKTSKKKTKIEVGGLKDTDARELNTLITNKIEESENLSTKSPDKQVIPVIGGSNPPVNTIETIQKVLQSLHQEGDSTPTQDETMYNATKTPETSAASTSFLSPPPSTGEAISFLTNFLDQAVKTPEVSRNLPESITKSVSQNGNGKVVLFCLHFVLSD